MSPTLGARDAVTSPAVRWTAAFGTSLALHAAGFALISAPPGSPIGQGSLPSHPLQARLITPPQPTSRDAPAPPRSQPSAAAAPEKRAPARDAAPSPPPASDASQPLGLRAGPVYYLPSQLDQRPHLLTRVDPSYPRLAPPDGGYVLLRLLISEEGRVERVLVVVADPEGYFEETAAEAFRRAQFSPGKREGITVKSQLWIEMKFHPLAPPTPPAAVGPR